MGGQKGASDKEGELSVQFILHLGHMDLDEAYYAQARWKEITWHKQ